MAEPRPKRARAKNKAQTSPLPMRWRPALLPRIGSLLDWCWRMLARAMPGVLRGRPLARLARLAAGAFYTVAPGNLLWPVLEPCTVQATAHVVRDEVSGTILDCWIWVRDGWAVLWQNGALGKGILSRSDPTWALRFRRDEQPQPAGELYIEDLTQRRRAARQDAQPATRRPAESLGVADNEVGRMEPVQLSPFEALFLSELGCINIAHTDGDRLTHAALYALLESCHPQRDFALKYAAYYYYRAKGWVVRSGLKFGADFLLYKQGGPTRSHSQYSVVVRPGNEGSDAELRRSWQYMAALSRVCSQTRKSLIMCHVYAPDLQDLPGPPDLSRFEIREFLVERFNANSK
ncbi:tRNA splicing endonuclease subunit sen2 [Coemansia spiralis]|nr:tRNA splicing endonuclease subunit sen2 [Coemansia spiralis]